MTHSKLEPVKIERSSLVIELAYFPLLCLIILSLFYVDVFYCVNHWTNEGYALATHTPISECSIISLSVRASPNPSTSELLPFFCTSHSCIINSLSILPFPDLTDNISMSKN